MSINPHKGRTGLTRVWHAMLNSFKGFKAAYIHESAFRQEVWLAAIMIPLALWMPVSAIERLLLIGTVLIVMIVELLNSAVEAAIDRIGMEHHELSGRAKDFGSSAVFIALLLACITWGTIGWRVVQAMIGR